jgi:hypothetical protein
VVRGPAALLGAVSAAAAYVLVAPSLPQLRPPELSALVACAVGLALVVAIVAGVVLLADAPLALLPAVAGAGLIVAALDVNGLAAGATPFEAVLFACLGVAFAVLLDAPALAFALPLFVAGVDIVQAYTGGSAGLFALSTAKPGDALTLELPDWGTGLAAARISVPAVLFLAAFAAYARRLRMRERAAEAGMFVGLLVAAACEILLDVELPALALMCAGYLLANMGRFRSLLARAPER